MEVAHTVRKWLLVSVTAATTSCGSGSFSVTDLPSSVKWVAVVQTNGAGGFVNSSPLVPFDGPLRTSLAGENAWILGYDDLGLGVQPDRIDREEPLTIATPCAPTLPAPIYVAGFRAGGTLVSGDASAVPGAEGGILSAKWLIQSCPSPDLSSLQAATELRVDLTTATSIADSRCSVRISEPRLSAYKWPSGELCIHDTQQNIQKVCPPNLPHQDSVKPDCSIPLAEVGRQLHVQWPPLPEPLPASRITQKKVADVDPYVDPGLAARGVLEQRALVRGYLYDLLPLKNGTLVVSASRRPDNVDNCGDNKARLIFFDQEALNQTSVVEVDGCVRAFAPDPDGDGFLGLMLVPMANFLPPEVRLVRFDNNGSTETSVVITGAVGADGIYFDAARDTILSVFRTDPESILNTLRIGEHSPINLQELVRNDLGGVQTDMARVQMDFENSETLAFALDAPRRLCRFSMATRTLTCFSGGCSPLSIFTSRTIFLDFLHDSPTGSLLTVGGLDSQVVVACSSAPDNPPIAFPGFRSTEEFRPATLTADPSDPSRLYVFGLQRIGEDKWVGSYVVFEPASGWTVPVRFPLPGSVVSTRRVDSQNRLWLLQPWDSAFIRVNSL
jgi:hypothetical protein